MKTTEPDETKYHSHKYGGNGFVVIADVPSHPKYCFVGDIYSGPYGNSGWEVGNQFFVANKDMLEPDTEPVDIKQPKGPRKDRMIPEEAMEKLHALREKLSSGTHKIVNTRLVPA